MAFNPGPMPILGQRSCAIPCHSGSMGRSGGRVGLRDESRSGGVFCPRDAGKPPGHCPDDFGRVACPGPWSVAGQVPSGASIAEYAARRLLLRLTSPRQRSSIRLTEGYAWARHGVSTFNPREKYGKSNPCGNFFPEASLLCLDAKEGCGSGAMLLQTPCDSLAASGQGSVA